MINIPISKRLETVAKKIRPGAKVVDIGTDHGYLPIYLIKSGISNSVIATDINKSPLSKALKNAADLGIEDQVSFRLSDGLDKVLPEEAECICVTGMGGSVIIGILEKALATGVIRKNTELVLSPHSDKELFRRFLYRTGFKIVSEEMIQENNWFYIVFKCVYDGEIRIAQPIEYRYGKGPLERRDKALYEYLRHERVVLERVKDELDKNKSEETEKKKIKILSDLKLNEEGLIKLKKY